MCYATRLHKNLYAKKNPDSFYCCIILVYLINPKATIKKLLFLFYVMQKGEHFNGLNFIINIWEKIVMHIMHTLLCYTGKNIL